MMANKKTLRSQSSTGARDLYESPPPETPRGGLSFRRAKSPDDDYDPSHEKDDDPDDIDDVYKSPNRNIKWREPVQKEARDAVIEESVRGDCCAICGKYNHGKTHTLAHLLNRSLAKEKETIERLERNWGLEKGTFFLHSRSNMFILCPNCHADLDSGVFGVLPPTTTIDIMENFTKLTVEKRAEKPANELFEFDPDNPIRNRLICLDWPKNYPMPVYVVGKNDKVVIKSLYPPFNQRLLTHMELHVNPFYLIWNLGRKLVALDPRSLDVPDRVIDDLFRVRKLFLAWGTDPPPEEVRRSKRLRTASTAKEASNVDPPDAKRARSTRSAGASSRR